MEQLVIFASLARIVPYAIVVRIGIWKKYRWLSVAAGMAITIAVLVATLKIPEYIRSVLASVTAFSIMMHAIELSKRDRGGR